MLLQKISDYFRHEFRVISQVRPIVWIMLYIIVIPTFALIYHWLPDNQFRMPDGAPTDYAAWLYYSVVTITTLGFGDYTPAHGWAQSVTAIEVMCGLLFLGFFLNAVGSLKSENDVSAEIEKQKKLHEAAEHDKIRKQIPSILRTLSLFISSGSKLQELLKGPSSTLTPAEQTIERKLMKSAFNTSLYLDSLQTRVDLTLWPELLENCFTFVANYQVFSSDEADLNADLPSFLKENLPIAADIEEQLRSIQTPV